MTNNTDTARGFLKDNTELLDKAFNSFYAAKVNEGVADLLVAYASHIFTPAPIESGLDFLERKLKEGWGLEASDLTNCLAALLDEYGQRNPAPIRDGEINKKILGLVPVGNKTVEDSMIPSWVVRRKMRELIKWYRSAFAIPSPLITDEEAWKYAKEHGITALGQQGFMAGVKWYRSALTRAQSKKEGEWISVKDRLPEDKEYVLVFTTQKNHSPTNVLVSQYESKYGFISAASITHWQPLPAPPKTGQ